jgi:hypothetical protein
MDTDYVEQTNAVTDRVSSTGATTSWSEAHPDGHVLPVGDAFQLDREVIERLAWGATAREAR